MTSKADHKEINIVSAETTKDVSLLALRTLITLNGGAFFLLLTFLGSSAAENFVTLSIEVIVGSLWKFLLGLTWAMVSISLAYYFSQRNTRHPDLELFDRWWFTPLLMCPAIMGFVFFFWGVAALISGIEAP